MSLVHSDTLFLCTDCWSSSMFIEKNHEGDYGITSLLGFFGEKWKKSIVCSVEQEGMGLIPDSIIPKAI